MQPKCGHETSTSDAMHAHLALKHHIYHQQQQTNDENAANSSSSNSMDKKMKYSYKCMLAACGKKLESVSKIVNHLCKAHMSDPTTPSSSSSSSSSTTQPSQPASSSSLSQTMSPTIGFMKRPLFVVRHSDHFYFLRHLTPTSIFITYLFSTFLFASVPLATACTRLPANKRSGSTNACTNNTTSKLRWQRRRRQQQQRQQQQRRRPRTELTLHRSRASNFPLAKNTWYLLFAFFSDEAGKYTYLE